MKHKTQKTLVCRDKTYTIHSLKALSAMGYPSLEQLPYSLKILLENVLRCQDGVQLENSVQHLVHHQSINEQEMFFKPARVLMQDFTGVPAVADLAAMRDALAQQGKDPGRVNPLATVDLVIDHSVMVDHFGNSSAFEKNVALEYQRNGERYAFLRWAQQAFQNFRVVPPGTGICHQVNLEYLAKVVWIEDRPEGLLAYPDTVAGTDSHTTMVNSLSVLGWGVGGIEAEAVMLGQPISMVIPKVVGVRLTGCLQPGTTATDLVLTITQMLRFKDVVGKFVEFTGSGLQTLSLADRATLANMAPEYGATCGFFPTDEETLAYLRLTGRDEAHIQLVEMYAKEQGLWWDPTLPEPLFDELITLDMGTVESCLAGPKRPQDRVLLSHVGKEFNTWVTQNEEAPHAQASLKDTEETLTHGSVVIAAITSCTNTSNPSVLVGAGLLAQKAVDKGLHVKPWIKTSLAPGSQVVSDYLSAAGLQDPLNKLGFHIVGYGCTTCIGNSGPLPSDVTEAVTSENLNVCAVLSGNRNFEGRINPLVKSNYLASPLLVVAYALAGHITFDFLKHPLGHDTAGHPVYLKDIWPTSEEIKEVIESVLSPQMFKDRYAQVFAGDTHWQQIQIPQSQTYRWDAQSTYIKAPPYFTMAEQGVGDIINGRPLVILGDSVTTDHISPAGSIKKESPAGAYLLSQGVASDDFNAYGARRGNHEVMIRGTFANIRLQNEMVPGVSGGITKLMPEDVQMNIFDAAECYRQQGTPLIVIAGKEYGTGSSRDWAAKGTRLLGIRAVLAESFERIHRTNLVGMGVLPLTFTQGENRHTLQLKGVERFSIRGLSPETLKPRMTLSLHISYPHGEEREVPLYCRIDTEEEAAYFKVGGILPYVAKRI